MRLKSHPHALQRKFRRSYRLCCITVKYHFQYNVIYFTAKWFSYTVNLVCISAGLTFTDTKVLPSEPRSLGYGRRTF